MTKKRIEFITNFLVGAPAVSVFGLLMYNDIVLRKTSKEIPYMMILLIAILAVLFIGVMIISKIKKQRFAEDISTQDTYHWKHFLRSFFIVTFTNLILNEAHYIAKSARKGMIPIEKAVTDITKIYGLFFVLFIIIVFATDYFSKKKANKTHITDE